MAEHPDLQQLPDLPKDGDEPVFNEPWQAQAFALAVKLQEQGYFSWTQWCETLHREIQAAQAAGDPDLGCTYYLHWLAALEHLVVEQGLGDVEELARRKQAWARVARETPHGQPLILKI